MISGRGRPRGGARGPALLDVAARRPARALEAAARRAAHGQFYYYYYYYYYCCCYYYYYYYVLLLVVVCMIIAMSIMIRSPTRASGS